MPRETTYGLQFPTLPDNAEVAESAAQQVPVVDVMWNRDGGYVQIVSKVTDPYGGRFGGDDAPISYTDGMYVDLDRTAINKLIRDLRRARDQAFGRDE